MPIYCVVLSLSKLNVIKMLIYDVVLSSNDNIVKTPIYCVELSSNELHNRDVILWSCFVIELTLYDKNAILLRCFIIK